MVSLGEHQLAGVLEVARAATSASDPDAFRDAVLAPLRRVIPCDFANLIDYTPETEVLEVSYDPDGARLDEDVERAALAVGHPIVDRYLESGDGSAVRVSDLVSDDEYHRLDIYREHYGPAGIERQLSSTVPCPEWHVMGVNLVRERVDFSDEERAALDLLRPFLVQGFRNAETRACVRGLLEATPAPEDGVSGAALVAPDGTITEATPGVGDALQAYRKLGVLADDGLDAWADTQRTLLDDTLRLAEPLIARHDDRRLALRLVPGDDADVVLADDRPRERTSARLRGFGLTRREADVLLELAHGASNAQIALALGISRGTVKSHLERIYRKLGVDGRTAAVALTFEVLGRA